MQVTLSECARLGRSKPRVCGFYFIVAPSLSNILAPEVGHAGRRARSWRTRMFPLLRLKPNTDKIDDAVLALLHLTSFTEGKGELAFTRAWKGHDWEALNRLHQTGMILSTSLMAS